MLHKMLKNETEINFYVTTSFIPDVNACVSVVSQAWEDVLSYWYFGEYSVSLEPIFGMGFSQQGIAYIKVRANYIGKSVYDTEAKAEALEFIYYNPVPSGGYTDVQAEKAYCLKIHNFLACKVVYSQLGYSSGLVYTSDGYSILQEAYNCLAEDQYESVCASYSRAFALICNYAGINCAWVRGNVTSTSSHSWNVVFPCDGSAARVIDVTWDDCLSSDKPGQTQVSQKYFWIVACSDNEHRPLTYVLNFINYANGR